MFDGEGKLGKSPPCTHTKSELSQVLKRPAYFHNE